MHLVISPTALLHSKTEEFLQQAIFWENQSTIDSIYTIDFENFKIITDHRKSLQIVGKEGAPPCRQPRGQGNG